MNLNTRLYFISFTEGAAVMAAEIAGAKLLAPFFGGSLYVWSSVMAVTLAGLASGYFIGGKWSKQSNKEKNLLYILLGAIISLGLMPLVALLFSSIAALFSLIPAVVLSVFILLFPVTLFMGATSPTLIAILTHEVDSSGENSGRVYAISTVGGILATFACGFYLIPEIGITYTLLSFAAFLTLATSLFFIKKKSSLSLIVLPFIFFTFYSFNNKHKQGLIHESESVLGKLEVIDEKDEIDSSIVVRKLLINNIVQTEMDLKQQQSVSNYISLVKQNISFFPKGKALILGLGGGLVANTFLFEKYTVTGVEFDERVLNVAKKYFYLNSKVKTICDDARHFINQNNKEKFNVVLFDIFKAEEQPSHVITMESLQKLKLLLDSNSIVVINTHGYINGNIGKGTQCLITTLNKEGFNVNICSTGINEDYRNLVLMASLKPFEHKFINQIDYSLSTNNRMNRDEMPVLEKLNAEANFTWRKNYLNNYILLNN